MRKGLRLLVLGISLFIVLMTQLYAAEYTFTTIDYPGAAATYAHGINNSGKIVGAYHNFAFGFTFPKPYGFIYDGSTFTTIDYPSSSLTVASDINNSDQIVGFCVIGNGVQGFIYNNDEFTSITYPEADETYVYGINNLGKIVGTYFDNANVTYRGFIYDGTTFTTIDYPGADETHLYSINNSGQIVGIYVTSGVPHGFIYDGNAFTTIDYPGANSTEVYGINDSGQIVGIYISGDIKHGFLATPVPVPASLFLLSTGLTGLLSIEWFRKRKKDQWFRLNRLRHFCKSYCCLTA